LKKKPSPLLILISILVAAGGVFLFFDSVILLEIRNLDRSPLVRVRMPAPQYFTMFYVNSIYDQPVEEVFQVSDTRIFLQGVKTRHAGVMEYYGFDSVRDFHPVHRNLGSSFEIQQGMRGGQGLILGDKRIHLSELGEKGDRIQIALTSMPFGIYFLSKWF
jgi:hypothetical protein